MRLGSLFSRVRRPLTVLASVGVVATGFMPAEALDIARPAARRVVVTTPPLVAVTPTEMTIEKLGMTAPIVPVGTQSDGTMASPTGAVDIGWWQGRKPGEGNALFAAHVNWKGAQGSFGRLKELQPGDEIVVRGDGRTLTYKVIWVRNFDPDMDATQLLGNSSGEQVATLITCGGVFDRSIGHHTERVVARAVLSA